MTEDPFRKGGFLTKVARAWDRLRAAAADASTPGHSDRVAHAAGAIKAALRAQRDRFDFDAVVAQHAIPRAAAIDAAATIYQAACEDAAADDVLTVVELDSLEALAITLRLSPRDVGAVHNVVGMPPVVDPATGELKPFGYSGALKVVAIAGVAGKAIGTKLVGAGGAAAAATLSGIRGAMAKRPSATSDDKQFTEEDEQTAGRMLRLRCLRGRLGQEPDEPAVEVCGRAAQLVRVFTQAVRDGRCVAITYRKSPREEPTARLLEVADGLHYRGVLMLRAWQLTPRIDEPCWRTFRLDRIASAHMEKQAAKKIRRSSLIEGAVVEWSPAEMDAW